MRPRDRCLSDLNTLLATGRWQAGDRLPPEVDLAARLGVSRETLRWAIDQLILNGLLHRLPGQGRKSRGLEVVGAGIAAPRQILVISSSAASNSPTGDTEASAVGTAPYAADIAAVRTLRKAGRPHRNAGSEEISRPGAEAALLVHVAGVIVLPSAVGLSVSLMQRAQRLGLPVAIGTGDPDLANCDRVYCDHNNGAAMLVRWLISRSFVRIRYVSTVRQDSWWSYARYAGYNRAMIEAGLTPLPRIRARIEEPIHWDEHEFEAASRQLAGFLIEALLGPTPTQAILATNDWEARMIARAARLLGLVPGRDLAIVGYDNSWNSHLRDWEPYAPCATIDQDWADHGTQLATLLDDRLAGRLPHQPQDRSVKPRLLINDPHASPDVEPKRTAKSTKKSLYK